MREVCDTVTQEAYADIAALFFRDESRTMQALWDAVAAGDAGAIKYAAHKLRGAAANLGFEGVARAAQRVDRLAVQGEAGLWNGAAEELRRTITDTQQACAELGLLPAQA